jgi:aldose 1-epimerase
MASPMLTLRAGALELVLAPVRGGGIARFDFCGDGGGKVPIFRPLDESDPRPVALASFPLVPFVNRVRGGRFDFRGKRVTLAQNMHPDPSPLHGQGWLAPWETARNDESGAELVFHHRPGEWPWAYEARQIFALDAEGLRIDLACTNRSSEPMPCGLGQHPYFPCTPSTRIDTQVESVWTIDEDVLPVEKLPASGRYDLRDRLVCGQGLDHGFGGWGGTARITDPALPFSIEIKSADARFFQLYSPAGGGLFVAEPVTHANAALNEPEEQWGELGLKVLQPGETMRLTSRFAIVQ